MGSPGAYRSAWAWSAKGPSASQSLHRKGGVTQAADPDERVLPVPRDLLLSAGYHRRGSSSLLFSLRSRVSFMILVDSCLSS